jgi:hypothetical protein
MTKGKGNNNDDSDDRPDLTRIEDLSEFLHPEDADVDDKFGGFDLFGDNDSETTEHTQIEITPELPEEEEISFEDVSSESAETSELEELADINFGDTDESGVSDEIEDSPFELSSELITESTPEENTDDGFLFSAQEEVPDEEITEEVQEETQEEVPYSMTSLEEPPLQEKFEEVKNFAQNFSYGQVGSGGNPPFSLVIRNLKYAEEAEDILIILRELGIVTDQNTSDTQKSLERGILLVPQISEYSAIVLAHKFRRFDCDIEVGLSDEVHPSKSGDTNPRGLSKKNSLRQNIAESYKKRIEDYAIEDIIVSTTTTLEDHTIQKYLGVVTSFSVVDETELERLKYVQQTTRSNTVIEGDDAAFNDFQKSFDFLFVELCDQLKVKAIKAQANALLGLTYQITAHANNYQITCSATLAVVGPEKL